MTFSAAGGRLTASPDGRFLTRDWVALLAICLLAVAIRASVMALLPSILHPDERMWLEAADRLVTHKGLLTWDFQVGERSWLWPGLIAGFMAIGQLFGSPPDAALGGVSALICIVSLAPVICGFLWGRNVAGFTGAVTTGVLNAVWFELVYFYTHPLSESSAARRSSPASIWSIPVATSGPNGRCIGAARWAWPRYCVRSLFPRSPSSSSPSEGSGCGRIIRRSSPGSRSRSC